MKRLPFRIHPFRFSLQVFLKKKHWKPKGMVPFPKTRDRLAKKPHGFLKTLHRFCRAIRPFPKTMMRKRKTLHPKGQTLHRFRHPLHQKGKTKKGLDRRKKDLGHPLHPFLRPINLSLPIHHPPCRPHGLPPPTPSLVRPARKRLRSMIHPKPRSLRLFGSPLNPMRQWIAAARWTLNEPSPDLTVPPSPLRA